jgi:hypothetical protein
LPAHSPRDFTLDVRLGVGAIRRFIYKYRYGFSVDSDGLSTISTSPLALLEYGFIDKRGLFERVFIDKLLFCRMPKSGFIALLTLQKDHKRVY